MTKRRPHTSFPKEIHPNPAVPPHRTALLPGRFQPFHLGHRALALRALESHERLIFVIRSEGPKESNPLTVEQVERGIKDGMFDKLDRIGIWALPWFDTVVMGRDPGYTILRIGLDPAIEAIRGRDLRKQGTTTLTVLEGATRQ